MNRIDEQEIINTLENDIVAAQQLLDALSRETQALRENNHDHLVTTTQEKEQYIQHMSQNSNKRVRIFKLQNLDEVQGMQKFFDDKKVNTRIIDLRMKLDTLLSDIERINNLNFSIINVGYQQIQIILDTIYGTSQMSTYGKDAKTQSSQHSSLVSKA